MTVPARPVYDTLAILNLGPDYHVLEDLVDCMTGMERAVGVRRSIVEYKGFFFRPLGSLPGVIVIRTLLQIFLSQSRVWPGSKVSRSLSVRRPNL